MRRVVFEVCIDCLQRVAAAELRPPRHRRHLPLRETRAPGEQRGGEAAGGGEHQPQAGDRAVAGDLDQIGADGRREAAEHRGREAVGEREARRAHTHRHDLGEETTIAPL